MNSRSPNLNSEYISFELLRSLKVKFNKDTVRSILKDHPNYPSLLSISDCLRQLKVSNEAYRIEKSEYDSSELNFPFLASIKDVEKKFVLVQKIENGKVNYKDEFIGKISVPEEDFLKIWDGIALHAKKDLSSGEQNYMDNKLKYILNQLTIPLFFLILGWIIFAGFQAKTIYLSFPSMIFIKLIGVITTIMLLSQSYGIENITVQNICKMGKSDCSKLLRSDAANVTSWLSWSEIGFFYFAGTLLALLLEYNAVYVLVWVNLFSLPYSIYSIVYQYKNNKWCILCCTVQLILWIEFISAFTLGLFSATTIIDFRILFNIFLCLLIPIVIWGLLKPLLKYKVQVGGLKFQLNGFKYNANLFTQALYNQPRYAVPDNVKPIIFGNENGENVITIVSDPFCSPCLQTHGIAKTWSSEDESIKIKMLFHVADDLSDPGAQVANHILSLNVSTEMLAQNALEDWYSGRIKTFKLLKEQYPAVATDESLSLAKMQRDWCKMADITYTPTVFINGYKIPIPYKIDDLKNLMF
ncbi:cysteine peptidase family C39 domain-containing protein [Pedobacter frigidisoli]|uniref:cysteine peptidase family C39 domain-containing protein n=1 Tax=Pedobacter frigidisoli TaxID=2530455 RepID=UPI00292F89E3|nr:cysteine peptidase family C39 domain-containing protein [Pedobacter frigidisoli]